jgi:hypothetical protein
MGAVMTYGWYKLIVGIREGKYVSHPYPGRTSRTECECFHNRGGLELLTGDLQQNSELAREKMWARIHLTPLLQAEEDRDQVRRYWADQAREKELMGENFKVYNSDRYVFTPGPFQ